MSFAGLIACKETEGFSATALGDGIAFEEGLRQAEPLTDEALASLNSRMRELEFIEDDINLRDANIRRIQDEIDSLKETINTNNSVFSSGTNLTSEEIEALRAENEASRVLLESKTSEFNGYIEDRIAKDQELMQRFTEMVAELSRYETNERSQEFRNSVLARLEVYEADRERLAELIVERESSIASLNQRIAQLESGDQPEDIEEKTQLAQELVEQQESLNEMNQRLTSLVNLVEINSCAVDPSSCPEDLIAQVQSDLELGDEEVVLVDANKQAEIFTLGEEIKELQTEKENLNITISQIDEQLSNVDTKLALARESSYQDQILRGVIAQLNQEKNVLMQEKTEALRLINEINVQISRRARTIVSQ